MLSDTRKGIDFWKFMGFAHLFLCYGQIKMSMENWQRKTKVLGEKTFPIALWPLQSN
jgi:hypothetical protein